MYNVEYTPSLRLMFTQDDIDPRVRTICNNNFTRTRFNSKGELERVPANEPRIGYHIATGSPLGLMCEQSRINYNINSEMWGGTQGIIGSGGALPSPFTLVSSGGLSWSVTSVSTDSKNINVLDLTVTGVATSDTSQILFESSTSVNCAVSQRWTGSLYLTIPSGTKDGINYEAILMTQRTSVGTAVLDTLATCSNVNTVPTIYSNPVVCTTGVERITHSLVVNTTVGASVSCTYRIAMPQLERGWGATSFIPTSTGTATRPDEINYIRNIQPLIGQREGTIMVEYIPAVVDRAFGISPTMFTLTNTAESYYLRGSISLSESRPTFTVVSSGTNQLNILSVVSVNTSMANRAVFGYRSSGAYVASDVMVSNVAVVSGAYDHNKSLNTIYIGLRTTSVSSNINGAISQLIVYPTYMEYGEASEFLKSNNRFKADYSEI